MKLSTRSRYGMRASFELAKEYGNGPLQIKTIAQREGISNKYLEQLVSIMKAAGLVRSIRGPKGGYELAKDPREVKLSEVFRILEGPFVALECIEHSDYCERCPECVMRGVWSKLHESMQAVMDKITLQDLVDECETGQSPANYQI